MESTKGAPKRVLGRGLSALLQDSPMTTKSPMFGNALFELIYVELISVNPCQPRQDFNPIALQELSDSIKVHGIIQPLTVRKLEDNAYQLIAGERRLRAAKLAGLTKVPAYIRMADDHHMLEMALVENIQRASLNAIEIALSYQRLLTECKLTQEALAERVGKDRTTINNYLRLLKLPPAIQIALRDQKISMGHARALITLDDTVTQLSLLKRILASSLSVREVEKLVQNLTRDKKQTADFPELAFKTMLKELSIQLMKQFNTKVLIKADVQNQGEIKILFCSEKELKRIISLIAHTKER